MAKEIVQPRHAPAGHQGHGGPAQAARGDDAGQGAQATRSTCRCTCTCTTRRATASRSYLAAIDAGVDVVDGAVSIMAGMTSQPSLSSLAFALAGSPRDPRVDPDGAREAVRLLGAGARVVRAVRVGPEGAGRRRLRARDPGRPVLEPARAGRGAGRRRRAWEAVKRAYADVNRLFGDIPKVTPSSKVVGDMAIWMVKQGLDARAVTERAQRADLPRVGHRLHARVAGPAAGRLPRAAAHARPQGRGARSRGARARRMPPFDWAGAQARDGAAGRRRGRAARRRLVRALPQGAARVHGAPGAARRHVGAADADVLLRPARRRGGLDRHRAGQDADRQAAVDRRHRARRRARADFELNGQPRSMRVADDVGARSRGPKRRKATPGKPGRGRRADAGPGDRSRHQGRREA